MPVKKFVFQRFLLAALALPIAQLPSAVIAGGANAESSAIIGRWEGESICVKADWNSACNDEVIRYDVERSAGEPEKLQMRAFKKVAGEFQPMGDLTLAFEPTSHRWFGDFENSRVKIRWSYEVTGDRLTGTLKDRDGGRLYRNVQAHRVK